MKLKNNPLQNKSYDFALQIVKLSKKIVKENKEYVLSKQILRSGTSVGANIMEANGAISKADFSAKMSIAYKECLETKYWLSLLKDSHEISTEMRLKIQKFAQEHNYRPNVFALNLKNKRSKSIGIIIPNILNLFFAKVFSGIEKIANEKGYNLVSK